MHTIYHTTSHTTIILAYELSAYIPECMEKLQKSFAMFSLSKGKSQNMQLSQHINCCLSTNIIDGSFLSVLKTYPPKLIPKLRYWLGAA